MGKLETNKSHEIALLLSPQSRTERQCDYYQFYTDVARSNSLTGPLSGTGTQLGHGTTITMPIGCSKLFLHFKTDGSTNYWGYKMELKTTVFKEVKIDKSNWTLDLKKCLGIFDIMTVVPMLKTVRSLVPKNTSIKQKPNGSQQATEKGTESNGKEDGMNESKIENENQISKKKDQLVQILQDPLLQYGLLPTNESSTTTSKKQLLRTNTEMEWTGPNQAFLMNVLDGEEDGTIFSSLMKKKCRRDISKTYTVSKILEIQNNVKNAVAQLKLNPNDLNFKKNVKTSQKMLTKLNKSIMINCAVIAVATTLIHHHGLGSQAVAVFQSGTPTKELLKLWTQAQRIRNIFHTKAQDEGNPTQHVEVSEQIVESCRFLLRLHPEKIPKSSTTKATIGWDMLNMLRMNSSNGNLRSASGRIDLAWSNLVDQAMTTTTTNSVGSLAPSPLVTNGNGSGGSRNGNSNGNSNGIAKIGETDKLKALLSFRRVVGNETKHQRSESGTATNLMVIDTDLINRVISFVQIAPEIGLKEIEEILQDKTTCSRSRAWAFIELKNILLKEMEVKYDPLNMSEMKTMQQTEEKNNQNNDQSIQENQKAEEKEEKEEKEVGQNEIARTRWKQAYNQIKAANTTTNKTSYEMIELCMPVLGETLISNDRVTMNNAEEEDEDDDTLKEQRRHYMSGLAGASLGAQHKLTNEFASLMKTMNTLIQTLSVKIVKGRKLEKKARMEAKENKENKKNSDTKDTSSSLKIKKRQRTPQKTQTIKNSWMETNFWQTIFAMSHSDYSHQMMVDAVEPIMHQLWNNYATTSN